ncbi:hypothetical protein [Paenibacillus tengchongensis]|uniref:hypothetical protein n=1 Tax=Paenibacillus tengchongensis TaxID=2608684 RepID=UPI00124E4F8F|nr:hypothetical protein [Paenibacillus tengchongensis]
MELAYYVTPSETPKALPFSNKNIEDILEYVEATDISDLEIIPITQEILIWANSAVIQARHNLAFKLDVDDSLVYGKAIFTGTMNENGTIEGLTGPQFSTIPNLIQFPNY